MMKKRNANKIIAVIVISLLMGVFTISVNAWQVGRESQTISSDCGDVTGILSLYADTEEKTTDTEFEMSARNVCSHYPLNVNDEKCKLSLTYKYSYPYTYTTGALWWKEEHTGIMTTENTKYKLLSDYGASYRFFNLFVDPLADDQTLKSSSSSIYAYIGAHDLSGFRFDMTVSANYNE